MPARKRLLILGSTGSIGTQALDVMRRSDELELVGLSAETSWETLVEQARAHGVDADRARRRATPPRGPPEAWTDGEVLGGPGGSRAAGRRVRGRPRPERARRLRRPRPDGGALGEGIDLALANKESLVVGGELVTALAEATGARILPGRLRARRAAPADRRPAARGRSSA